MGASVVNISGAEFHGTIDQIMELLSRMAASSVVNVQGARFVILAAPIVPEAVKPDRRKKA